MSTFMSINFVHLFRQTNPPNAKIEISIKLENWHSQRGPRWGVCHYDLDLWPFDPKIYRCLPFFIPHLCMKYEVCRLNTVRVIALQQSVDRRTDGQTDKLITIGLPHLRWRGPNKVKNENTVCLLLPNTSHFIHFQSVRQKKWNIHIKINKYRWHFRSKPHQTTSLTRWIYNIHVLYVKIPSVERWRTCSDSSQHSDRTSNYHVHYKLHTQI